VLRRAGGQSVSRSVMALRVDRCICRSTPFADLLPRARAQGWTLEDLMRETGCGAQCGLCRPYLRRMLRTGETVFHELLNPDQT
jgi:bacterioferritin-associated ferredoxin